MKYSVKAKSFCAVFPSRITGKIHYERLIAALIRISKEEANYIRSNFPKVPIVIVNRQHAYKHYFVEEAFTILSSLYRLRGTQLVNTGLSRNGKG